MISFCWFKDCVAVCIQCCDTATLQAVPSEQNTMALRPLWPTEYIVHCGCRLVWHTTLSILGTFCIIMSG